MSKLEVCLDMLSSLCPMHLVLNGHGRIVAAGPTIRKISPVPLVGQNLLDVFEIRRPKGITDLCSLHDCNETKLTLQFRGVPHRQLRGLIVSGPEDGLMTVNLSFGISVVDAVKQHELTAADFAPTDLTVEMLYLVEAKSAAMDASRKLNKRLEVAREAAEQLAQTDMLTGLMNRRAMDQAMKSLISMAEPFALMHIDLDYFKDVNDTMGHAAGDAVLQSVAQVMVSRTRKTDMVARVGGDEFVIILPGCTDRSALTSIGGKIISGIKQPVGLKEGQCGVSCSIGVTCSTDYEPPNADIMLRDADIALYSAKRAGRERCVHYTEYLRDRVSLEVQEPQSIPFRS